MEIKILSNKKELGQKAAQHGAGIIRSAIQKKGSAHIIVATGASQFEMLSALVEERIDWTKVNCFHLDEYIGLPAGHPASFRKYLKERFVDKVRPATFHYVNGNNDPQKECGHLGKLIGEAPIDVAFIGIGENGHLAFNDPPADFKTEEPFLVVTLDADCRKQQLGEGWFASLEEVPAQAISMSIRQIMKSHHIICSVPDQRKALAVRNTVESEITPMVPASILKQHPSAWLFLDQESASLLNYKSL